MGDPERYRKSEEVQSWQENDPIGIYARYLVDNQVATPEELAQLDSQVQQEIEEAVQFAESSPEPAPESLYEYVYVENP